MLSEEFCYIETHSHWDFCKKVLVSIQFKAGGVRLWAHETRSKAWDDAAGSG
jgi:hypothetical protein